MKVFLTGASGFIGSRIVDELIKKGHEVTCLVHEKEIDKPGVKSVKGDVRNKASMDDMKGCDAVIHNAAIYTYGPPKPIRNIMRDVNVAGTKNTLDLALEYGIPKIVYVSSIAVYGDTSFADMACEDDLSEFKSPCKALYIQTKREAHLYAQKLIDEHSAPIVIAMPSVVYGENDHSAVGGFLKDLVTGNLLGNMSIDITCNYNYVGDVAKGIVLCLEKGQCEPYILGGPAENNINPVDFLKKAAEYGGYEIPDRNLSLGLLKFVEKIYRIKGWITGKQQLVNKELLDVFTTNFRVTNEKAVENLGYSTIPLEEGIKRTMDWYIENYDDAKKE